MVGRGLPQPSVHGKHAWQRQLAALMRSASAHPHLVLRRALALALVPCHPGVDLGLGGGLCALQAQLAAAVLIHQVNHVAQLRACGSRAGPSGCGSPSHRGKVAASAVGRARRYRRWRAVPLRAAMQECR